MSRVVISSPGDLDCGGLVSHQLDVPDATGKVIFPSSRSHHGNEESEGNITLDILETAKELIMYMDVPAEDEKLLEVRSNGKRKHEENEEEGCKYLRLERRPPQKLITVAITVAGDVWKRKFKKSQLQVAFGG
ncbi:unnamed protein product [Lactuca virosa]|uniref:Uncharacterized protein n=1 Tax=Lactuca virosa TaxID=75947 RepID=A0AAU9PQQ7_9ASTR|nr:unnamed protein product [Lactuca virosa]